MAPWLLPAVLFPWLLVWQGLDLTDFGHWVTKYQLFLTHPTEIENAASVQWLTHLVGGLLEPLARQHGLMVYRAAFAAVASLLVLLVHGLLRGYFDPPTAALASLLTCLACASGFGVTWLDSHAITALLYVLSAGLLHRGLLRGQPVLLAAAGAILALNAAVKPPNIAGLLLLTSIRCPRGIRAALLGFSLTGVACLAGVLLTGHLDGYLRLMGSLLTRVPGEPSHHDLAFLTAWLLRDQLLAVLIALGALAVLPRIPRAWLPLALAAGVLMQARDGWRFLLPAFCYAVLGPLLLARGSRQTGAQAAPGLRLLAGLSLAIVWLFPLGSTGGLRQPGGLWLALGLALGVLLRGPRRVRACVLVAFLVFALPHAWNTVYRDGPDRLAMTATVAHPALRGILTTEERARCLEQLLTRLQEEGVRPGDVLLCYPKIPLVHYLTRTFPYLRHPAPVWFLRASDLDRALTLAERDRRQPLVVRSRHVPEDWSYQPVVDAFLQRHPYRVVWSNHCFDVLRPSAPSEPPR
ncbi:MAG: hypothetical protein AB1758_13860 [Candidatus Eremiobacterota bacterium]